MNYKELSKFIGSRIRYIKPNTRYGWGGRIEDVSRTHVSIMFDQCFGQDYVLSAFIAPGQAKNCECPNCGFMSYGYLEIIK